MQADGKLPGGQDFALRQKNHGNMKEKGEEMFTMKNVKKVLALLLVAVFLVSSLAACGKGDDKKTETDNKGNQTQDDKKDNTDDKKDDSSTGDEGQDNAQAGDD